MNMGAWIVSGAAPQAIAASHFKGSLGEIAGYRIAIELRRSAQDQSSARRAAVIDRDVDLPYSALRSGWSGQLDRGTL